MTPAKTCGCGQIDPDPVDPAMRGLFKTGLDKHSDLNGLSSLLELAFPKAPLGVPSQCWPLKRVVVPSEFIVNRDGRVHPLPAWPI